MNKTTQGIYQSPLFDSPSIIHGFSTKQYGDMREKEKRKTFLSAFHTQEESLVWQEQVHGGGIHVVTENDRGKIIQGVDGLSYCINKVCHREERRDEAISIIKIASPPKADRNDKVVVISVHTADCVPLLFYDPVSQMIGAAHAGWRGTVLHIGQKMVKTMEALGSKPCNIRVVIGPHICGKCYSVEKERADIFRKEFNNRDVMREENGKYLIDIGIANYTDFITCGVDSAHIDFDQSLCTYCTNDEFYSFRRSGLPLEGEILGVIGFRN